MGTAAQSLQQVAVRPERAAGAPPQRSAGGKSAARRSAVGSVPASRRSAPGRHEGKVSQAARVGARRGHRTRPTVGFDFVQHHDGGLAWRHGLLWVIRHAVSATGPNLGRAVAQEGLARRQLHWPLRPEHLAAAAIRDVHGARGGHRDRPHPFDVNRLVVRCDHGVAAHGSHDFLLRVGAARHDREAIDRTRRDRDAHGLDPRGSRRPERLRHGRQNFGPIGPGVPRSRADERNEP